MDCKHKDFEAYVKVCRLTETEEPDAKVTGYSADILIKCMDCGLPFEFIGVPGGYSPAQPMVSANATELCAPIRPSTDPAEQATALLKKHSIRDQ